MKKNLNLLFAVALFISGCKVSEEIPNYSLNCETDTNKFEGQEEIDRLLQASIDDGLTGGVLAIYSETKGTYQKAFGYADLSSQTPMELCHQFRVASLTKPFTAIATILLMEEGKLDLDMKVTPYLKDPRIAGMVGLDEVSIKQLLT